MRLVELNQKSAEWLAWRRRGLGGSDAPVLVHGKHYERNLHKLWQDKTAAETYSEKNSSSMERGNKLEPEARRLYRELTGLDPVPVCCVHEEHPWLKASLDGWIGSKQVVVEIKAVRREEHEMALAGQVPDKFVPQLDHLLLVTGGRFAHYVSFNDYFKGLERLAVVHHPRDKANLDKLFQLEYLFWHSYVLPRKPPPERLTL